MKKAFFIVLFLVVLNFFAWREIYNLNKPALLEVVFFDVGQGDAAFIKTPKGHRILIDGGPDDTIIKKLEKEIPFYNKYIDLVILTHPHSDHLRGLIDVIETHKVHNILSTGVIEDMKDFKKWEELLENQNVVIAKSGIRIISGDVFLDVLYPFEILEGESFKDSNNTSIISRLVFNNNSFLFMGDAYKEIEEDLINFKNLCKDSNEEICEIIVLDSDVLKVGHHGSKTSTSEKFLSEVTPNVAVISSGRDNRYGHPHEEVLANLNNFAIETLLTSKLGDIRIISNGNILYSEF